MAWVHAARGDGCAPGGAEACCFQHLAHGLVGRGWGRRIVRLCGGHRVRITLPIGWAAGEVSLAGGVEEGRGEGRGILSAGFICLWGWWGWVAMWVWNLG